MPSTALTLLQAEQDGVQNFSVFCNHITTLPTIKAILDSGKTPSLSVASEHLLWIFGVNTREEAMKKLEGFRLEGVVQKIACPFLLLHGEGDEQIPLEIAHRVIDKVGSKDKTLKVFTREEGGYHHCQIDNVSIGVSYMWDWIQSRLAPAIR